MTRHGPVVGFGRALGDLDLVGDEAASAAPGAGAGLAQRPPGAQAGGQLPLQRAACLHVEGLVDRLVGDPHRLIIGEVDLEPVADLLRAPRHAPAAVLAAPVSTPRPRHVRAGDRPAFGVGDLPGELALHVGTKPRVGRELGLLRALRGLLRLPLGHSGAVPALPGTSRGVAAQLPRDRRRVTTHPASDLPHAVVMGPQQRDFRLFTIEHLGAACGGAPWRAKIRYRESVAGLP